MKKILVTTDFSPQSDRAIRRATLLARQFDATLLLIHVAEGDSPGRTPEEASVLLAKQARSLHEIDGVSCLSSVVVGVPHEEIVKAADSGMADLSVVGPHPRQTLADVLAGTTVEQAIRVSTRPILMANGVPAALYRHVMVAVDLSECSGDALRAVVSLGLDTHVAVSVVYVFDAPTRRHMLLAGASDEELSDYLAREETRAAEELGVFLGDLAFAPARQLVKLNDTSVAHTICAAAREAAADLIIVGTRGRTGVAKLLLGSVAKDVLDVADHDVLVVPPRPRE